MQLRIPIIVEVPDGATHYLGNPGDEMSFYKCRKIGVAGDHWFQYHSGDWKMVSHYHPSWIQPIPEEWRI